MDLHQEVVLLQLFLAALTARYYEGERSSLYAEARALLDEVTCLMDEAPAAKQQVIGKLAQRYEDLLRSLAN